MKKHLYTIIAIVAFVAHTFAQAPANDNCTSATSIGSLPAPVACPTGTGATVTYTGTTVNGTASSPYPYMIGCSTGGVQQSPAIDVWYSFVATGTDLHLTLNSSFATPNVGLWSGSCASLAGVDCMSGSAGGVLTYTNVTLTPGNTYFIQISGNTSSATGTFTLGLNNGLDCNNCLTTASFSASPAPVNGTYQPGQTVNVCFNVNGYTEISANWIHGVEYTFGAGWNLASLVTNTPTQCSYDPTPGPGNAGNGTWAWYNSVVSSATGLTHGPGYFFDNINVAGTNPGQNFGDPTDGTCTWQFCFSITTNTACVQDQSLNITANTLADGESGSWTSPACSGDPTFEFNALMTCCTPPTMTFTNVTCSGNTDGVATATGAGASPWDYVWKNSVGTTINTTNNLAGASTISGLAAGIYSVSVTDNNGCTSTGTVSIGSPTVAAMTSTNTAAICNGGTVNITLTSNIPSTYSWIAANNANTTGESTTAQSTNTLSNTITNTTAVAQVVVYTVTPTSITGSCVGTPQTVSVTVNPTPTTTASTTGTLTCTTSTVALNSTLAGMSYTWTAPAGGSVGSANSQTTTASTAPGTYTLLVQSAAGCTYSTTTSVTQNTTVPTTTASTTGTLTCTTLTVALNSTLAGMNYTWTAPAGGSVGSASTQSTTASGAAGTYTIRVVNPTNGCSYTTTTTVTQNIVTPTTTASTTGTLTCSTTTVALNSTLAGMNYTWTAPAGGSVGSANTQSTTASGTAGTYTLVVLNSANGCTYTTTSAVTQNTTVPTTAASTTGTLTCSTTTVALNSTLAGMNYTWTAPAGGSVASANTQSTTASGASGTYTVKVVNPANGCSYTTTTAVTQNTTVPTTTASTTGTLTCTTSTVALNSTLAGMNYTWTAPAGGSVASANAQSTTASGVAGTYSLVVVNPANGCTYSTTTAVTQNTAVPTVTASPNQTLTCAVPTVTLTGSATPSTCTPVWTGGVITGSTTYTATASSANVYTLTVTNPANGCTNFTTTQVFASAGIPSVTTSVTNSLSCSTLTAQVVATTTASPVSYSWTGPSVTGGATTASATVNAGGQYTVVVTNTASACSTTVTVSVTQNTTAPTTTASTTGVLTCATTTVALNSTLAGMNYTWTAPAGGSVGSANTQSTTASGTAGTYTVKVVNSANGCSYTTTTAVTQNTTVPTTTASTTGTLTCTTSTVTLNSTLAGMNYTWTAPAGGSVSTANAQSTTASSIAGTYSLTVVNPANGCTYSTTTTVTQNTTAPTVTASANQTLTCTNPTVTLTGSATPSTCTPVWTGGVTSGSTTYTATASSANIYTLTVTDPGNGCTNFATTQISPSAGAPTPSITSTALTIDCNNASQSVTVTSTPSTDVTYTWNNPPAILSPDGSVASFTSSNTYICTVTNTLSNCSTPIQVVVSTNTAVPTTTTSVSGVLTCTVLSVDLNSTLAGMNYTWTTPVPSTVNTQSTTATMVGDYTLTVVDPSNGCTFTTTATVTQNTLAPTLSAGSNQTLSCSASSVTLNGSITTPTNALLDWGTSVCGTQTTAVTSACAAGVYTLTATDPSNGCVATSTVEVFPNAGAPTPSISATVLTIDCNNATQSVTVTSTPSTDIVYHWNNTPSSASVDSSMAVFNNAGTYVCTVTNTLSNCSTPIQVVVTTNTTIPTTTASTAGTLTCTSSTVTLNSTLAGMNYTWTAPASGSVSNANAQSTTATDTNAGTYSLTVVDPSNGCTFTTTATVTQNTVAPAGLIAGPNQTLSCSTNSVTITATASSSGSFGCIWLGPGVCGFTTTVSTEACSAGTYTVIATDPANGCSSSAMCTVFPNAGAPTATVTNNSITLDCITSVSTVTVTSTPNTNVTYSWSSTPSPATVSANGSIASFNTSGVYICTVTNTLSNCSTSIPVGVFTNTNAPTISSITGTQTLTCANPTATISTVVSPSSGITYTWTGTSAVVSGQGTGAVTVNTAGDYSVMVMDAANGCTNTASSHIDGGTVPTATIVTTTTNSIISCLNPTVTLTTNVMPLGTYSFTWVPSGNTGTNENVTTAGPYGVIVLNTITGCTTSAQYTVNGNTNTPPVTALDGTISCGASSTILNAMSTATNVSYNWTTTGTGIIATPTASSTAVNSAGQYVVVVTDATNGCSTTNTVTVISVAITASISANPTSGIAPLLVGFVGQSSGVGNSYSWNFADDNNNISSSSSPNHVYNTTGNYVVTLVVTDPSGLCSATSTVSIDVFEAASLVVPNVFTPNGDSHNDVFKFTATGVKDLTCDIFNRWGLKLYSMSSVNDSWDGGAAPAGTYFFILKATGYDGTEFNQQGFISLFK